MAVTVCIWTPGVIVSRNTTTGASTAEDVIGHASLKTDSDYLSFWPATAVGFNLSTGALPVASAFMTMADDRKAEAGAPQFTVTLNKLDEKAIASFIKHIKSTKPLYHAKGFNCSHPVKIALYEGSKKTQPNFVVHASAAAYAAPADMPAMMENWARATWNPLDVLKYANQLKAKFG